MKYVLHDIVNNRLCFATAFLRVLVLFTVSFPVFAQPRTLAHVPQTPTSIEQERRTMAAQTIDSVVIWVYAVKNNKPDKRGRMHSVMKYDVNGNITRASHFPDAQTETGTEYRYDAAMRLVEERPIVRGGAPAYRWQYRYDTQNRLTEAHYLTSTDESAQKKTFRYSTNTLPSEMVFYRTRSKIGYRDVWSFSEASVLPTQKTRYRADNTAEQREEYRYNSKGELIELLVYSGISIAKPLGDLVSRKEYAYDSRGNLLEETDRNESTKSLAKQTHRYDQTGLRVESQYFWAAKPPLRLTSIRQYLYSRFDTK
jgi:hypothetical protein